MVGRAARLKFKDIDVLSKKVVEKVEKCTEKLDFQRKLRAYQRQGKEKRISVAKFAKKHGFSYSAVRRGLKTVAKRTKRLEQRLETHEKASEMTRVNGSAIRRSIKRPALSVRTINRELMHDRWTAMLRKSKYWADIKAEIDQTWDELMLGVSEWPQFFDELQWIIDSAEADEKIPKAKLTFFRNVPWVNRLFGRKP